MTTAIDFEVLSGVNLGLLVASALWGMTSLQAIEYCRQFFKSDPLYIKVAVTVVWSCSTAHLVLQVACLQEIFTGGTKQPVTVMFPASMIFGFVVQAAVQSMYALRIFKFCHRFYVPIFCWVVATYSFAVQTTFTCLSIGGSIEEFFLLRKKHKWMMSSGYTMAAFVDIIITFAFCCLLHMNRGYVKLRTKRILEILCLLSIENGLATSLIAITIVVLFNIEKSRGIFLAFVIILVHVYALTMMTLLNRRTRLRSINTKFVGLDAMKSLSFALRQQKTLPVLNITPDSSQDAYNDNTAATHSTIKLDDSTLAASEVSRKSSA